MNTNEFKQQQQHQENFILIAYNCNFSRLNTLYPCVIYNVLVFAVTYHFTYVPLQLVKTVTFLHIQHTRYNLKNTLQILYIKFLILFPAHNEFSSSVSSTLL